MALKVLKADAGWDITDHCCRFCLSGVLRRGAAYRCATCGQETSGKPNGICGCGMPRIGEMARCGLNENRTPENPARIIIHIGGPASAGGKA